MTETTTLKQYCTVKNVKDITGIKSVHWFKKESEPESKLDELLTLWINLSSEVIDKFTNNTFDPENIPGSIHLACLLMVSNIVAFSQSRRDTPIIKKDDWNVDFVKADFLNDDIKDLLSDFVKTKVTSSSLNIYAVTGRNPDEI